MSYRLLDKKGNKIGTPIKASQFYNKPTLKNLELKFKENETLRERHALRIKTRIDLAIHRGDNTLTDLYNTLRSDGISIVARQSNKARIYGMTFIDHQNRCVFNGSSLGGKSGKAYPTRPG